MNPMLKAPEIKRLKLKRDEVVSSFAFKFNLRRYNQGISSDVAKIMHTKQRR